jgi:hypothetical protein
MNDNPENVKYALVRRRKSAWRPGAKAAAIVAIIQLIFFAFNGTSEDAFEVALTTTLVFFAYWIFFTFIVWVWRVFTGRA